jgi:hypothetical protein
MAFKIYYEDGKRIKSWEIRRNSGLDLQCDFEGTDDCFTPRGVVAIIQDDDITGWTILTGYDYYVLWKGHWVGANYHQLLDYLIELDIVVISNRGVAVHRGGKWRIIDDTQFKFLIDQSGLVLTGRNVSGKKQKNILQEAAYDAEFPMKSEWYLNEPRIAIRAPGVAKYYEKNREL